MGRKPDLDKRRELAQAAFEQMRDMGMSNATMSALAEAIGVKRPTLYHYFPTRRAILEVIFEEMLNEEGSYVLTRLERTEGPIDQLIEHMRAVQDFHTGRERDLLFLLQTLAPEEGEQTEEYLREINRKFQLPRKYMVERLREAIDQGELEPIDPEALTRTLRAINEGLLVQRCLEDDVPIDDILLMIRERLLEPLRRQPGEQTREAIEDEESAG